MLIVNFYLLVIVDRNKESNKKFEENSMELREEDYKYIEDQVIPVAKKIFMEIYMSLGPYIKKDGFKGADKIKNLEAKFKFNEDGIFEGISNVVIVERPTEENIEFFKKRNEIAPPGHGGRAKNDGIIHLYPYSDALKDVKNVDQIIEILLKKIVIHEILHFYFMPDKYDKENAEYGDEAWFGHYLTEGIVQYYTEEYMKTAGYGNPQTGYIEQVQMVKDIVNDLKEQGKNYTEVLVNCDQISLLGGYDEIGEYIPGECKNGELIKSKFIKKEKIIKTLKQIRREYETVLKQTENSADLENKIKNINATIITVAKSNNNMNELRDFLIDGMVQYGIDNPYIEVVEKKFKEINQNDNKGILR